MNLPRPNRNGLFVRDHDDQLLFLDSPAANFAYVICLPADAEMLEALSRNWGMAQMLTIPLFALLGLRMGPLGMFACAAASLVGSLAAYRIVVSRRLAGIERIPWRAPRRPSPVSLGMRALRAAAKHINPATFWFAGALSTSLTIFALAFVRVANSPTQRLIGCAAAAIFAGLTLASSWTLAINRRQADRRETATAPGRAEA